MTGDRATQPAIHLVVLREPHYSRIISGEKQIEGRFCRVRRAPMGVVQPGDVLLLKRAGGPVSAWCFAAAVRSLDLSIYGLPRLRRTYDQALGHPGTMFWNSVSGARYATLIDLRDATELQRPIRCKKRDQRGWVVLREAGTTIPQPV